MFVCGSATCARPFTSPALASWPVDMVTGFIPCSYYRLGVGSDSTDGRHMWTLSLSPRVSRDCVRWETHCGNSKIAPVRRLARPDLSRCWWWCSPGQSTWRRRLVDTQPDSPGDQTSLASAIQDPGEDLPTRANTPGEDQTPPAEDSEAERLLASRLQGMFHMREEEAMPMVNSQLALLSLPEEGLDGIVDTLKALLAENEAEIIGAVQKQPDLLLLAAKGLLPEKIGLLTGAGLTLAEARSVLKSSPKCCMVDLATIQREIHLFQDTLDFNLQEFAKVVTRMPRVLITPPDVLEVQCRFFIDEMRLSTQQLKSWVIKDPRIILFSVPDLRLKFAYFEGEVGVSRLQLVKLVERQPQILALDLHHRIRPNVAYLKNELNIPSERLPGILVAVPGLLWFNIEDTLKPKVRWFTIELMLRRNQLRKIILQHPQVLTLSLEKNVGPKASWLKIVFGIDDLALRDMIVRHPALLLYSIETVIKPKMSFLRDEVGLEEIRLRKLLVTTPVLFSYNVETMRSKVSYLQEELQFDCEDVARVISRTPQLLGYRVASMKAKVAFIMQVLHTNSEETSKIISGSPTVLNLSIEKNLRLKIDLYVNELGGKPEDVRAAIVGTPSALGYSLTKRTRPRMQVIRLLGIEPTFEDHFWHLTSYTSVRFNRWLETQVMENLGAERRGDAEVKSRMKRYLSILHGN